MHMRPDIIVSRLTGLGNSLRMMKNTIQMLSFKVNQHVCRINRPDQVNDYLGTFFVVSLMFKLHFSASFRHPSKI
jgi:hypothetical protein